MQNKHLQALTGYAAVPVLLVLPFFFTHTSPLEENYSGMMAEPSESAPFYLCCMPVLLYLFLVLWKLGKETQEKKKWLHECGILALLILLIILIQYHEEESLLSSLHVFLGFLAFADLNWLLYQAAWLYRDLRIPYFCGLILAWFESLTFDSINGLAEIIYGCTLSWVLTCACMKKRNA